MKMTKQLFVILISVAVLSSSAYSQGLIQATVALTGNVFNEINRLPETAKIFVTDTDGNRIAVTRSNASDNGSYYISGLKPGVSYVLKVKKKGFFKEIFNIKVPNSDKYLELSQDFLIKPMNKGIKLKLRVSPFELHKSKLRFGSELFLENMLHALKNNEKVNFTIMCYPDSKKEKAKVTKERANSLKDYFVKNGIAASRISVEGSNKIDPDNPLPTKRAAKGKRYIGTSYIRVDKF